VLVDVAPSRPRRLRPRAGYLTIRVTGVMLAVLALGHFAATHVANDVADTGSSFIAQRWATGLWVTWDAMMLATALLHGAAGLSVLIRDYRSSRRSQGRWIAGVVGGSFVLFLIGAATLMYSALGER
jgi:succinate dehydrogenase hydrophobic anchor subunit